MHYWMAKEKKPKATVIRYSGYPVFGQGHSGRAESLNSLTTMRTISKPIACHAMCKFDHKSPKLIEDNEPSLFIVTYLEV